MWPFRKHNDDINNLLECVGSDRVMQGAELVIANGKVLKSRIPTSGVTIFTGNTMSNTCAESEMQSRILDLEEAYRDLIDMHHRTLESSRLHRKIDESDWTTCECLSCKRAQELLFK